MLTSLQCFQEMVGPLAAFLIPLSVGFLGGAVLPRMLVRRPTEAIRATDPVSAETETADDLANHPNTEMTMNWETRDNRRTPRRAGKIVEVLVAPPGQTDEPRRGLVLNRSNGGLGVLLNEEFPIGSMLGVMPADASRLTPWVEVEVKSCRKNPDGYELGLQYLMIPPYATLVMFG
jgi:PilZ domain